MRNRNHKKNFNQNVNVIIKFMNNPFFNFVNKLTESQQTNKKQ